MRRGAEKGRRGKRVANLIRQVVSEELVTGMSDPRLAFLTVASVEVSDDLRFADVRVSILGDKKAQGGCMRAIRHAHGFLQQKVADVLVMKYCPVLRFHLDDSIKRSVSMGALIAKARAEDEAARAERVRRGVEVPGTDEPVAETPPVPDEEDDETLDDDEDEADDEDEGPVKWDDDEEGDGGSDDESGGRRSPRRRGRPDEVPDDES